MLVSFLLSASPLHFVHHPHLLLRLLYKLLNKDKEFPQHVVTTKTNKLEASTNIGSSNFADCIHAHYRPSMVQKFDHKFPSQIFCQIAANPTRLRSTTSQVKWSLLTIFIVSVTTENHSIEIFIANILRQSQPWPNSTQHQNKSKLLKF